MLIRQELQLGTMPEGDVSPSGLFGFSPEGGTSLPVCVSHRIAALFPNVPWVIFDFTGR